jgi:hypothetical protein
MQKIYEAFNGPRTRDIEFDQKVSEVKQVIKAMGITTNIIRNFPSRTSGIRSLCLDLITNLQIIYKDKGTIFSEFANDVITAHKNIEKSYLSCCEVLQNCQILNSEWDKLFNDVKENINKREEARKVYDHYDEKMEELVKERNEKLAKKESEKIEDIEKFDRNDGKYKRAANDYINLSLYTYKLMQKLLDFRYKLINPLVATLVQEEKKFFDNCQTFFFKFENILVKINSLSNGFVPTNVDNYNPSKHIRANRLLNGLDVKNLTDASPQQKYSFNDYINKKGGDYGRSNTNVNNNNNNNNNNKGNYNSDVGRSVSSKVNSNVNPYSYEAYKQKTKNVNNNNNNNSNNNNSNNNYNNNNIINNPSFGGKTSIANTAKFNESNNNNNINNNSNFNFNFDNNQPVNNYDFGFGNEFNDSNNNNNNPYNNINFSNNNNNNNNTNNFPF